MATDAFPKVLWVEDGVHTDLANMLAPIAASGRYDLDLARDATDAEAKLLEFTYQAVVVDIRLPPGTGPKWINLYRSGDHRRERAKLGLHLLRALFAAKDSIIQLVGPVPDWIVSGSARFGVFTVETDLSRALEPLKIGEYVVKAAGMPRTSVLSLIDRLTRGSSRGNAP